MRAVLLLLLALAGCGDLPQPFLGNPGVLGARLAQPPPSRLFVPPPTESLLPDAAASLWAAAVADALQTEEVPAAAGGARRRSDWLLLLSAEMGDAGVVPSYTIQNPQGVSQGVSQTAPVPASAWASGDPAVLKAAAVQAAPGISSLLNRIEAARRQSDPNSLLNRPARIYFTGVTGAPGDGDRSLAAQMRQKLTNLGLVVQEAASNADYTLRGEVQAAPGAGNTVRIEVQWIVDDARGERGRILQLNEVPPATVASYWGDVAVVVATEAAGGIRDVISNAAGGKPAAK